MRIYLLVISFLISIATFAQEEILEYTSDINVNVDRTINVTETIKVRVEGINIKRGDFQGHT